MQPGTCTITFSIASGCRNWPRYRRDQARLTYLCQKMSVQSWRVSNLFVTLSCITSAYRSCRTIFLFLIFISIQRTTKMALILLMTLVSAFSILMSLWCSSLGYDFLYITCVPMLLPVFIFSLVTLADVIFPPFSSFYLHFNFLFIVLEKWNCVPLPENPRGIRGVQISCTFFREASWAIHFAFSPDLLTASLHAKCESLFKSVKGVGFLDSSRVTWLRSFGPFWGSLARFPLAAVGL